MLEHRQLCNLDILHENHRSAIVQGAPDKSCIQSPQKVKERSAECERCLS